MLFVWLSPGPVLFFVLALAEDCWNISDKHFSEFCMLISTPSSVASKVDRKCRITGDNKYTVCHFKANADETLSMKCQRKANHLWGSRCQEQRASGTSSWQKSPRWGTSLCTRNPSDHNILLKKHKVLQTMLQCYLSRWLRHFRREGVWQTLLERYTDYMKALALKYLW